MRRLLRGMALSLTELGAGGATVLVAAGLQYRFLGTTEPNHTCKRPRALKTGDIVVVLKVGRDDLSVQGPCGCAFLLYGLET